MKRLLLMVMLSALASAGFAQQRKTATRATTVRTSTNNKEVTQLKDSIVILNKRIDELEENNREYMRRLNVKPLQEFTSKDGTTYKVIDCKYENSPFRMVTVTLQLVNHNETKDINFKNNIGGIRIPITIDGNSYYCNDIKSGIIEMSNFPLEKDVVKNISFLCFLQSDIIPHTINYMKIHEKYSNEDIVFKELKIKRNL